MLDFKEYLNKFIKYPDPILHEIEEGKGFRDITRLFMEPETLSLIVFLAKLIGAKKILELGTGIGFSSIWLASALPSVEITSIEHNKKYFDTAKNFLTKIKIKNLNLLNMEINDYIKNVEGSSFDIVIQDSKKALYPGLLEETIRITKATGLIVADDVLLPLKGYPERISKYLDEYNKIVFNHPRLLSTIVPIGDGVCISKLI